MSGTPTRRRGPCGGDAEIKGRSAAESERSEDVRSIEGLGRLRRPPLNGPSRAPLSRRRRLNDGVDAGETEFTQLRVKEASFKRVSVSPRVQ
jgi:hypothetical protein